MTSKGSVDEPGLEIRGAHQSQRVSDGCHGLTEPEPEPKIAMVPAAAVAMSKANGGCGGRGGNGGMAGYEQVHPRSVMGEGCKGLTDPEPESKRAVVWQQWWLCPEVMGLGGCAAIYYSQLPAHQNSLMAARAIPLSACRLGPPSGNRTRK
jgi:hypothetical protein